jgi:translation initiation factor IF-2
VSSLRRFQEDVREVQTGLECGIGIEGFSDVQEEDVIEAFHTETRA